MSGPRAADALKRARLNRSKKALATNDGNISLPSPTDSQTYSSQCLSKSGMRSSEQNRRATLHALNETENLSQNVPEEFGGLGLENRKAGRGPARGKKLNKEVKKHEKFKIVFLPGESVAMEYDSNLTTGIGIIARTHAEIIVVSSWEEVSDTNKEYCFARLLQWFDIMDWSTARVEDIISHKFQKAYTRWRNTLHVEYKNLVKKNIKPREVCPRDDLTMVKWQAACDFIEREEYQIRSRINLENRAKMPFNHTSGRTPMLSRFKSMEEKSEIEHFKNTRVSKKRGGEFLNPLAKSLYDEMVEMRNQYVDDGEIFSEAEIVKIKLGHKSGYVKGMGHGLQVIRGGSSSKTVVGTDLKAKLVELDNAKEKIIDLTEAYEDQGKTIENQRMALEDCQEKNKTYSEEIDTLKIQMSKLKDILERIPGMPTHLFED